MGRRNGPYMYINVLNNTFVIRYEAFMYSNTLYSTWTIEMYLTCTLMY